VVLGAAGGGLCRGGLFLMMIDGHHSVMANLRLSFQLVGMSAWLGCQPLEATGSARSSGLSGLPCLGKMTGSVMIRTCSIPLP